MDASDLKGLYAESTKRMNVAIEHVKHELAGVRTGRASVTILDGIHVEAYGSKMPLNQVAGLSVPEPSLIVAQPFDPSQLKAIESAIRASDLGLNPANDGKVIRIPIPELNEERRKDLVRHIRKTAEEFRVSIRNHRRDANDKFKQLHKEKKLTEDEMRASEAKVQEHTTEHIEKLDKILAAKEAEIMEV